MWNISSSIDFVCVYGWNLIWCSLSSLISLDRNQIYEFPLVKKTFISLTVYWKVSKNHAENIHEKENDSKW